MYFIGLDGKTKVLLVILFWVGHGINKQQTLWFFFFPLHSIGRYTRDLRHSVVDSLIESAFGVWARASGLTFVRTHNHNADIMVEFVTYGKSILGFMLTLAVDDRKSTECTINIVSINLGSHSSNLTDNWFSVIIWTLLNSFRWGERTAVIWKIVFSVVSVSCLTWIIFWSAWGLLSFWWPQRHTGSCLWSRPGYWRRHALWWWWALDSRRCRCWTQSYKTRLSITAASIAILVLMSLLCFRV